MFDFSTMNRIYYIRHVSMCYCILLILLHINGSAWSQSKAEVLKEQLSFELQDSTRARLSGELAWELKFSEPEEAIRLADEEIAIARQLNNYNLLANGFRVKALTLVIDERIVEGMPYYDSAIVYARKANNLIMESSCYSLMAGMYGDHGDFDRAIELYTQGYKLAVQSTDPKMIAKLSNNLAEVYQSTNRSTEQVQKYFVIALENFLKIRDFENAAMSSANLAMEYVLNNQVEKANTELSRAIDLMNKGASNSYYYATTSHIIASAFLKLGRVNEAEGYALSSLAIMDSLQRPDNALRPLLVLTEIYVASDDMARAKKYAETLLKSAEQQDAKLYIRDANKALYEIAKKENKFELALSYFESYKSWNDSIFKVDREKSIEKVEIESALARQKLEVEYETEKNKNEKAHLAEQNEVLETRQMIVFVACFVFIVLIVLLYLSNRKKKKINQYLEEEKRVVQQKATENAMLVHEIHHRVKNNLTMLKGLLYLQGKSASEAETKRVLDECQARILSMSLVHQSLYEDNESGGIDFRTFLEGMFNELSASFLSKEKDIVFEVTGSRTSFGLVKGIPVALIINELVTNSLKYAFIDSDTGKILVEIDQEDAKTTIRYMDSGPGLKNGYRTNNGGFGFKLMDILTRQLKATMNYEKSGKFSIYVLEIPT